MKVMPQPCLSEHAISLTPCLKWIILSRGNRANGRKNQKPSCQLYFVQTKFANLSYCGKECMWKPKFATGLKFSPLHFFCSFFWAPQLLNHSFYSISAHWVPCQFILLPMKHTAYCHGHLCLSLHLAIGVFYCLSPCSNRQQQKEILGSQNPFNQQAHMSGSIINVMYSWYCQPWQ